MKILHINVRLEEGGAARVALDLHRILIDTGIDSTFAYGWGPRGRKSQLERNVPSSFRIGNPMQVASNILTSSVTGIDGFKPSGEGLTNLLASIQRADIIHLHAIHSYFLPFRWFLKQLAKSGKPIVWTSHDFWALTGRCASTEGCNGWRSGCGTCPSKNNYPPAYLDFSASQFKAKRKLLANLKKQIRFVSPSLFLAAEIRMGLPDANVTTISNWIDSEFEQALEKRQLNEVPLNLNQKSIRVLITANDLSDKTKVDRPLIHSLLKIQHVELHTIGQNSPFDSSNVFNHGKIADRDQMVDIISSCDIALFTSEKDTFGLVMIEALACGKPVLAIESAAATDVLSEIGLEPIKSKNEIISLLKERSLPTCYINKTPLELNNSALSRYSARTSVLKYISLYESAL